MKVKKIDLLGLFREMNKKVSAKKLFNDIYLNNDDFSSKDETHFINFLRKKGYSTSDKMKVQSVLIEAQIIGYQQIVKKRIFYSQKKAIKKEQKQYQDLDYIFQISVPQQINALNKKEIKWLLDEGFVSIESFCNNLSRNFYSDDSYEKESVFNKMEKIKQALTPSEVEKFILSLKKQIIKLYRASDTKFYAHSFNRLGVDKNDLYFGDVNMHFETIIMGRSFARIKSIIRLNKGAFDKINFDECTFSRVFKPENLIYLLNYNKIERKQLLNLYKKIKEKEIISLRMTDETCEKLLNVIGEKIAVSEMIDLKDKINNKRGKSIKKRL